MTRPSFMIIGAAKCGTTSIFRYLAQHPDIFAPRYKEPNFFALQGRALPLPGPGTDAARMHLLYQHTILDRAAYDALWEGAERFAAAGEASVRYLFCAPVAARLRDAYPDLRLVAVLRDPVERLHSHYNMNVMLGLEPLDLRAALDAEPERTAAGWGWDWRYAAVSGYGAQLERYLARFPREQLLVLYYRDFVARPLETLRAICRHVGVSEDFAPDMSARGMVPHRPRSAALNRALIWPSPLRERLKRGPKGRLFRPLLARLEAWNRRPAPRLDPALRAALAPRFHEDATRLADLLGAPPPWIAAGANGA